MGLLPVSSEGKTGEGNKLYIRQKEEIVEKTNQDRNPLTTLRISRF